MALLAAFAVFCSKSSAIEVSVPQKSCPPEFSERKNSHVTLPPKRV